MQNKYQKLEALLVHLIKRVCGHTWIILGQLAQTEDLTLLRSKTTQAIHTKIMKEGKR